MKIALGTDHAGFELKEQVKKWLIDHNYEIADCGTNSLDSVDYIDFAYAAASQVADHISDKAVIFCGTGLGSSYVANKVHGIRAALCENEYSARLSRQHNDANVLVLGGRVLTTERALAILEIWLNTSFDGGRHLDRINKISTIENIELKKNSSSKNN
ncbi:MAG: ribose 5-phosphate isomerase B [Brevinema sp.]